MLYASPVGQAWLRFWVDIYGPDSQLRHYLRDDRVPSIPFVPSGTKQQKQAKRRSPTDRVARRIERDIDRVTRMPVSDWAKAIVGDDRITHVTLQDILDGVEDYFEVFDQMRRKHPQAHAYFSRVGVPVVTNNMAVWASQLNSLTVASPMLLPSYFGVFLAETKAGYRERVLEDKSTLLDFHLFEKPKNHSAAAGPGTTVFIHNSFWLSRHSALSEAEIKLAKTTKLDRHPGTGWYVGVLPDGQVRALPYRRTNYQHLPNGGSVSHTRVEIPSNLKIYAKKTEGPHTFVRTWFNMAVAMVTTSVSGVTVTITQGKRRCRIGVPVAALKTFFADRDPESGGERRKAIMHLRHEHDRHMSDGRIIRVGEHLSGERFFSWRGYDVTVGVPGIHYPSPEGFNDNIYLRGPDTPLPPEIDPSTLSPITTMASDLAKSMKLPLKIPFRKGEPLYGFNGSTLPQPGRRPDVEPLVIKTDPRH